MLFDFIKKRVKKEQLLMENAKEDALPTISLEEAFSLKNRVNNTTPHAMVLGEAGCGVGFVAKKVLHHLVKTNNDNVIIVDPYGDFNPNFMELNKEECISINPIESKDGLNPLERISTCEYDGNWSTNEKVCFLNAFFCTILGRNTSFMEQSCIDKAFRKIEKNDTITLSDLYNAFLKIGTEESKLLSNVVHIYVKDGIHSVFNQISSDINKRIVHLNLQQYAYKEDVYLFTLEWAFQQMKKNCKEEKNTLIVVPHLFEILDKNTESYISSIVKQSRCKRGAFLFVEKDTESVCNKFKQVLQNVSMIVLLHQKIESFEFMKKYFSLDERLTTEIFEHSGKGIFINGGKSSIVKF